MTCCYESVEFTSTSLPLTFSDLNIISNAEVPDVVAKLYLHLYFFLNSNSNFCIFMIGKNPDQKSFLSVLKNFSL